MCNWNADTSENIAKYKELVVSLLYQTYDLIIISQIQDLTKNIDTEPIDTFTFLKYIKAAVQRKSLFNQFFVRQHYFMLILTNVISIIYEPYRLL